ncbi:MAG: Uma2 family endonuclease [Symploca sp. SIO3E6]|nr:Uma2 family endonuclease [Caldora sp. SIO3E6]
MVVSFSEKATLAHEQRLVIPGRHSWQQFKTMQVWANEIPGLRVSYLDGYIELMTTGKVHERIKKFIAILLEAYFFEKGIKFFPAGNATCEAEERGASFDPDESYCLGEDKEYPDLGIEVTLTSGGIQKLEKYKRFKVREVWFWQDNHISVHVLRDAEEARQIRYEQVTKSEVLPQLNLALLEQCVQISDVFEARNLFLQGLNKSAKPK